MKAAMYYGPKKLEIKEVEMPKISDNEILVRVRTVGLCPSDVRTYNFGNPHVNPPIIPGHEITGEVAETGKNVKAISIGDRVNVPADAFCGKCEMCRCGHENLCKDPISYGYNFNGAYAEYLRVTRRFIDHGEVFTLPSDVSFEEATFAEPVACCINAILKARVGFGRTVTIIGDGPMGLTDVQLAKLFGADTVIISGHHDQRLNIAKSMGVDYAINSSKTDAVKKIVELTNEKGVDAVIATITTPTTIEQATKMVGKHGIVVVFGGSPRGTTVTIDPNILHYSEACLIGSEGYTIRMYETAFNLITKHKINVKKLISHKYKLDNLLEAIAMAQKKERSLKIIIEI